MPVSEWRKELEAEGSPIMDDRANDGRGAWMASEGAGHEAKCEVGRVKFEREEFKSPNNAPTRKTTRSDARSLRIRAANPAATAQASSEGQEAKWEVRRVKFEKKKFKSPTDVPIRTRQRSEPGAFRAGAQGMDARLKTDEGWMPEFRFIEGGSDRAARNERSWERGSTAPVARRRRSVDVPRHQPH